MALVSGYGTVGPSSWNAWCTIGWLTTALGTAGAAKWVNRHEYCLTQPRATISINISTGPCGRPAAEAAERRLGPTPIGNSWQGRVGHAGLLFTGELLHPELTSRRTRQRVYVPAYSAAQTTRRTRTTRHRAPSSDSTQARMAVQQNSTRSADWMHRHKHRSTLQHQLTECQWNESRE